MKLIITKYSKNRPDWMNRILMEVNNCFPKGAIKPEEKYNVISVIEGIVNQTETIVRNTRMPVSRIVQIETTDNALTLISLKKYNKLIEFEIKEVCDEIRP